MTSNSEAMEITGAIYPQISQITQIKIAGGQATAKFEYLVFLKSV
jgi:hypothetical protein